MVSSFTFERAKDVNGNYIDIKPKFEHGQARCGYVLCLIYTGLNFSMKVIRYLSSVLSSGGELNDVQHSVL